MESRSSLAGQSLHLKINQILNPCLQTLIANVLLNRGQPSVHNPYICQKLRDHADKNGIMMPVLPHRYILRNLVAITGGSKATHSEVNPICI